MTMLYGIMIITASCHAGLMEYLNVLVLCITIGYSVKLTTLLKHLIFHYSQCLFQLRLGAIMIGVNSIGWV